MIEIIKEIIEEEKGLLKVHKSKIRIVVEKLEEERKNGIKIRELKKIAYRELYKYNDGLLKRINDSFDDFIYSEKVGKATENISKKLISFLSLSN